MIGDIADKVFLMGFLRSASLYSRPIGVHCEQYDVEKLQ